MSWLIPSPEVTEEALDPLLDLLPLSDLLLEERDLGLDVERDLDLDPALESDSDPESGDDDLDRSEASMS